MIIDEEISAEQFSCFNLNLPADAAILAPVFWDNKDMDFRATVDTIEKDSIITRYFAIIEDDNRDKFLDSKDANKINFLYPTDLGWLVELPESIAKEQEEQKQKRLYSDPDTAQPQTGCFRVEKYKLECEHNKVTIPVGSRVMQAGDDGDVICLWCLVDTRVKETEERRFDLYFTDELIAGHGSYVGTVRLPQGVYHVIEAEG